MRFVLLVILFQFIASGVIQATTKPEESKDCILAYHADQGSLSIPILLKEKEERESEEQISEITLVPLFDFTDHTSILTQSHNTGFGSHFCHQYQTIYTQPLFKLHCHYII